jgi:hypothetical protein
MIGNVGMNMDRNRNVSILRAVGTFAEKEE